MDSSARNHQEQHIDARRARQHVAYKSFVPRHIHKPKRTPFSFQESEAQINRDSAALLFGKTIGCVPVSASTSVDLPWSMCPAVPTMTLFIAVDIFECAEIPLPLWMLLEEENQGSNSGAYFAAAISSTIDCAAARGIARQELACQRQGNRRRRDSLGRELSGQWSSELIPRRNPWVERRASRSGIAAASLANPLGSCTEATNPSTPAFLAELRQFSTRSLARRQSRPPSWFSDPCS